MKAIKWLNENFEEFFMIIMLILLSCAMMYSVILRYIFNNSPSWTEEFCRYCYIWSVALSVSLCMQKDSAMRVSVVMDIFPTKVRNSISIFCNVLMLAMFAVLGYNAIFVVKQVVVSGQYSPAMRIPMGFMYSSFVLGFFLASFRAIQKIITGVKNFNVKQLSTKEQTMLDAQAEAELATKDANDSHIVGGEA